MKRGLNKFLRATLILSCVQLPAMVSAKDKTRAAKTTFAGAVSAATPEAAAAGREILRSRRERR